MLLRLAGCGGSSCKFSCMDNRSQGARACFLHRLLLNGNLMSGRKCAVNYKLLKRQTFHMLQLQSALLQGLVWAAE